MPEEIIGNILGQFGLPGAIIAVYILLLIKDKVKSNPNGKDRDDVKYIRDSVTRLDNDMGVLVTKNDIILMTERLNNLPTKLEFVNLQSTMRHEIDNKLQPLTTMSGELGSSLRELSRDVSSLTKIVEELIHLTNLRKG